MSDPSHAADADHAHPNYVKIYFVLLGLFAISVLGPTVGIGWLTLLTAFGVALVKAFLVCANFMHLSTEKRLVSYMLGSMLLFLFLLFAGVAPDVMMHSGHNWENVAVVEIPGPIGHGSTGHHSEAGHDSPAHE